MSTIQEFINEISIAQKASIGKEIYDAERSIEWRENELKESINMLQKIRLNLETKKAMLDGIDGLKNRIVKNIDTITSMKYVVDVFFEDKCIVIKTSEDMKAYTDNNDVLDLGPLLLKINMSTNEISVHLTDGNEGGYGYWTEHDPHPHVSGSTGKPCLGSAETPIALELSNYNYDVVAMIMLEYLQSVNIGDAAGAKYKGWAHTDADGNFHEAQKKYLEYCSHCEAELSEDERYRCDDCGDTICDEHSIPVNNGDSYVCPICRDENYEVCSTCDILFNRADIWYCEECETPMCDEHRIPLGNGNFVCNHCIEEYFECPICETYENHDHSLTCPECGDTVCFDCIEDGLCRTCYNEDIKADIEEEESADDDGDEIIEEIIELSESTSVNTMQEEVPPLDEDEGVCDGCYSIKKVTELTTVANRENETLKYYCTECVEGGRIQ